MNKCIQWEWVLSFSLFTVVCLGEGANKVFLSYGESVYFCDWVYMLYYNYTNGIWNYTSEIWIASTYIVPRIIEIADGNQLHVFLRHEKTHILLTEISLWQRGIATTSVEAFILGLITTTSNEEIFRQYFEKFWNIRSRVF